MQDRIPLLLFAKSPIPGQVKTRLAKVCGYDCAAEIAKVLLQVSVDKACRYWPGKVVLVVKGADHCHFSQELARKYSIKLWEQEEGDLGAKMRTALETADYPAAVMGCDVPHIQGRVLAQAHRMLAMDRNVIGPALDGGYYLLGLTKSYPAFFESKDWGGSSVMSSTIEDANQIDVEIEYLETLSDVDEWEDLIQVAPLVPELARILRQE